MTDTTFLAPFAAEELKARQVHWPKEVLAGRMTQADADADIAAWRAIAELIDTGSTEGEAWAPLLAALQRAEQRRETQARTALDRLAAVTGIRNLAERAAMRVGQFELAA